MEACNSEALERRLDTILLDSSSEREREEDDEVFIERKQSVNLDENDSEKAEILQRMSSRATECRAIQGKRELPNSGRKKMHNVNPRQLRLLQDIFGVGEERVCSVVSGTAEQRPLEEAKETPRRGLEESMNRLDAIELCDMRDNESSPTEAASVSSLLDELSSLLDNLGDSYNELSLEKEFCGEWLGPYRACSLPSVRQVFQGNVTCIAFQGHFGAIGTTQGYITLAFERDSQFPDAPLTAQSLVGKNPALRFYPCKQPVTALDVSIESNIIITGHTDGSMNVWDPYRGHSLKEMKKEHESAILYCRFVPGPVCQLISICDKGVMYIHSIIHVPFLKRITVNSRCLLDGKRLHAIVAFDILSMPGQRQDLHQSHEKASYQSWTDQSLRKGGLALVSLVTMNKLIIVQVYPTISILKEMSFAENEKNVAKAYLPSCGWKPYGMTAADPVLAVVAGRKLLVIRYHNSTESNNPSRSLEPSSFMPHKWSTIIEEHLEIAAIAIGWISQDRCCIMNEKKEVLIFDVWKMCTQSKVDHTTRSNHWKVDLAANALPASFKTFSSLAGYEGEWFGGCFVAKDSTMYIVSATGTIYLIKSFSCREHILALGRENRWGEALALGARSLIEYSRQNLQHLPDTEDLSLETLTASDHVFDELVKNQLHSPSKMQSFAMVYLHIAVVLDRTSELLVKLYERYRHAEQLSCFLLALEEFVLSGTIQRIPPEIVQSLIEALSRENQAARIEDCVMQLEITSLDLDQLFGLCKKHKLYNTMAYLYQEALRDTLSPAITLYDEWLHCGDDSKKFLSTKLFSYLVCCLRGNLFPAKRGQLPNPSIAKAEVVGLCLYCRFGGSTSSILEELLHAETSLTIALFYRLFCSWDSTESEILSVLQNVHLSNSVDFHGGVNGNKSACQAVSDVVLKSFSHSSSEVEFQEGRLCMVEFLLFFLRSERIKVPQSSYKEMEECLEQALQASSGGERLWCEQLLLQLVRSCEPGPATIELLEQFATSNELKILSAHLLSRKGNFKDSLLQLVGYEDQDCIFLYLEDSLSGRTPGNGSAATTLKTTKEKLVLANAVLAVIASLVSLDARRTVSIVLEYLPEKIVEIIHALSGEAHLQFELLFNMLNASSCEGKQVGTSNTEYLLDPDFKVLYIKLLCRFRPHEVLEYLRSNEDVRLDNCLEVCQEHQVQDAEAYILERMGQMMDALTILLKFLEQSIYSFAIAVFSAEVEGNNVEWINFANADDRVALLTQVLGIYDSTAEVQVVTCRLDNCISFCQRSAGRVQKEVSVSMWFLLLECLITHVHRLKLASGQAKSESMGDLNKWSVLQTVSGTLVSRVMVHMAGCIPLSEILREILHRHSRSEVGEFRSILVTLLEACSYEHATLKQASKLTLNSAYHELLELLNQRKHGMFSGSEDCKVRLVAEGRPRVQFSYSRLFGEIWQWSETTYTGNALRKPGTLPQEPSFNGRVREREMQPTNEME